MPSPATIISEIHRVFPDGTRTDTGLLTWEKPPIFPTDIFAVAGHLLECSGAYQFIVAPFESETADAGKFRYGGPTFCLPQDEIIRYVNIGRAWATDPSVCDNQIGPIWKELLSSANEPLVIEPIDETPEWWKCAHALLIIADEACSEMGYRPHISGPDGTKWAHFFVDTIVDSRTVRGVIPPPEGCDQNDNMHLSRHVARDSIAMQASRDVVRVLPKGRTTEIGCSPRTLSHNLALLPGHGHPNAYWHPPKTRSPHEADFDTELNILLVPFPYEIPAGSFVGIESHRDPSGRRWGRYRIQQRWLHPGDEPGDDHAKWSSVERRQSFIAFVDALIDHAEAASEKPVNAVVLPEYSVDWMTYDTLVRHLRDTRDNIEFVVSGVSVDCLNRLGNQVTFSIFDRPQDDAKRGVETHSRRKHHRWLLDFEQIDRYGLKADLDPEILWWEYLEIESRIVHVDVFRSGSTLTAVICEDLARVDPGLSLLRNLGPNIVFALLMDGPQISNRWSGVYATSLADDPGSSVLSLTSFGLIDRSNVTRKAKNKKPGKNVIALWKHHGGSIEQIELQDGEVANLLSLKCENAKEITIDGRSNADATAWIYTRKIGIKLSDEELEDGGWKWIVPKLPTNGAE